METVIITTKPKDDYVPAMPPGMDPCDAWVCSCDHWLCNGCKPLVRPIAGRRYEDKTTGRSFIFRSCEQEQSFIKGIKATSLPRPFYVKDYSKDDLPGLEVSTTLYWNYLLATNRDGEANFRFYTNDINGEFVCILQGISEKGPISARAKIHVIRQ